MPQQYTELNPNLPGGEATRDTLQLSRGFQGDTSSGGFLKDAADVLGMAVGAIDLGIKTDIKETARREVDAVQNEFGVGAVSTTQGIPRAREIPEDLKRSTEALQDLKRGYNQGVLSQSTYWARLESISRQLRSRYAGHRDYIDQTIAGITGGIPANKLVEALRREADDGNSAKSDEEKRQYQYTKDNEKYLPPGFLVGKAAPVYYQNHNALRDFVATQKRIEYLREQGKAEIDFRAAGNKEQIEALTGIARKDATATLANSLKPLTDSIYEGITAANAQAKTKGSVDPALEKDLTTKLAELDLAVSKQIRNVLGNPAYDRLPKESKDNIVKGLEDWYGNLKKAALDKDVGPFGTLRRGLEASRLSSDVAVEASPINSIVSSVKRTMGDAAAGVIFQEKLPDIAGPAPLKRLLQDVIKGKIALGQIDVDQAIKYGHSKGASAAEINQSLKDLMDVAGDSTKDLQLRKKIIMNTFQNPEKVEQLLQYGPDSKRLNAKTRTDLFNTLVRPDVANTVRQLGDQAVKQRYGEWVTKAASVVYQADLSDLSGVVPPNSISVFFDTKTNKFLATSTQIQSGQPIQLKQRNKSIANAVNRQLEVFNSKIETLTPVWKAAGLDPVEEIRALHGVIGVDNDVPKGFESLKNLIYRAIPGSSIQGGEGRSEKKGGEGNDRILSFVNSQGIEVPLTRANIREFIEMWNREEEVVPSLSTQMELEGARESTNVEDVSQFQQTGPGRFAAPDLVNEDPNFRNPEIINKETDINTIFRASNGSNRNIDYMAGIVDLRPEDFKVTDRVSSNVIDTQKEMINVNGTEITIQKFADEVLKLDKEISNMAFQLPNKTDDKDFIALFARKLKTREAVLPYVQKLNDTYKTPGTKDLKVLERLKRKTSKSK